MEHLSSRRYRRIEDTCLSWSISAIEKSRAPLANAANGSRWTSGCARRFSANSVAESDSLLVFSAGNRRAVQRPDAGCFDSDSDWLPPVLLPATCGSADSGGASSGNTRCTLSPSAPSAAEIGTPQSVRPSCSSCSRVRAVFFAGSLCRRRKSRIEQRGRRAERRQRSSIETPDCPHPEEPTELQLSAAPARRAALSGHRESRLEKAHSVRQARPVAWSRVDSKRTSRRWRRAGRSGRRTEIFIINESLLRNPMPRDCQSRTASVPRRSSSRAGRWPSRRSDWECAQRAPRSTEEHERSRATWGRVRAGSARTGARRGCRAALA